MPYRYGISARVSMAPGSPGAGYSDFVMVQWFPEVFADARTQACVAFFARQIATLAVGCGYLYRVVLPVMRMDEVSEDTVDSVIGLNDAQHRHQKSICTHNIFESSKFLVLNAPLFVTRGPGTTWLHFSHPRGKVDSSWQTPERCSAWIAWLRLQSSAVCYRYADLPRSVRHA